MSDIAERDAALTLRDLEFGYGQRSLFHDFNWSVGRGVTALLGPNGAGKTTLMRLIVGDLAPRRGEVVIGEGRRVGYLPQHFSFVGNMRVRDATTHASWSSGVADGLIPQSVSRALSDVGLAEFSGKKVKELSGGQRQRLGIACILSQNPGILLLDEPTVGLDPEQRRDFRNVIKNVGQRTPIIMSTHIIDDVPRVASSVSIICKSKIVFQGSIDNFNTVEDLESHYLETLAREASRD